MIYAANIARAFPVAVQQEKNFSLPISKSIQHKEHFTMANLNIDANNWPAFILRWIFAGVWATLGYAICSRFLLPHIPGL